MENDRTPDSSKDWRELCRAAATELDPAKLINLISELTRALNERDKNVQSNGKENKRETKDSNSRGIPLNRELAV